MRDWGGGKKETLVKVGICFCEITAASSSGAVQLSTCGKHRHADFKSLLQFRLLAGQCVVELQTSALEDRKGR